MKKLNESSPSGSGFSDRPFLTWFKEVRELEREESLEVVIAAYEKLRTAYPLKDQVYDRLMALYRKTGQTGREFLLIESELQLYKQHYGFPKQISEENTDQDQPVTSPIARGNG